MRQQQQISQALKQTRGYKMTYKYIDAEHTQITDGNSRTIPISHRIYREEILPFIIEGGEIEPAKPEEELLADFLDQLPAGFFSADSDGVIRYANSVLADWLGMGREEIIRSNMRFSD